MRDRWDTTGRRLAVAVLGTLTMLTACQPEQRPGTVETIGGGGASLSASASGSVSGSVSAPVSASSPASSSASGSVAGPPAATAQPVQAAEKSAQAPTRGDGIYTPVRNVDIYTLISSDYQEIVALTNQVNEGKPLPSAEILKIYEEAKHAKTGDSARILRDFARDPARAEEFPEAAAFYGSPTFLDDPVIDAINGTGSAAQYTPAQRRQAIQKGVLRILYHWSMRYVLRGASALNPGLVDEAWAIYMGAPVDGTYPNSLSAVARSREANFNRPGSIDTPLRQALSRAQQAAAAKDAEAYRAAQREISSRFNALFYLASARYLNEALKSAQSGQAANAAAQLIEGLAFYQSIQPTVATADAAADKTLVEYYTSDPTTLTPERRDAALAALNRAADALLLQPTDRLSPADFR